MPQFCLPAVIVLVSGATLALAAPPRDVFREDRERMVREFIEQEGVTNERVLHAMRTVPRHEFVLPEWRSKAYLDAAWPIGHKQTISPPYIVAYMTATIDPQPGEKVLEIGTGSGYQAAVLSGLCEEVYTIEIVEALGKSAEQRLRRLGYDNVHAKVGDGYKGWPEHAPFDKIIVTCSPEDVPQPLVDQLKDGGRMIVPLGERYQQVFHLFEKKDGRLESTKLIPTLFVPMTGISEEQRDVQPDPLNPRLVNGGFEDDENGDGKADGWHYQRQTSLEEAGAREGQRFLRIENVDPGRMGQVLQGMAVDGRAIRALHFSLSVKTEGAKRHSAAEEPCLMVHYFDSVRRMVGTEVIGPWEGTEEWHRVAEELRVPVNAREAIVRVGLNGGTGILCVDDVRMTAKRR